MQFINYNPLSVLNKLVDGTYFFLNENQLNLIHNENKDTQLEMTWLPQYRTKLFKIMNYLEELKFTQEKPVEKTRKELSECFEYFMNWKKLENYSYKC